MRKLTYLFFGVAMGAAVTTLGTQTHLLTGGSAVAASAETYRKLNAIPHEWGTAVNVQAMVYGNLGDDSATGVAFTRDPSTGERRFFGEFLPRAQGEYVVAGIRTPQPIAKRDKAKGELPSLEELMPKSYRELLRTAQLLEKHYTDMQDLEFTIQRGQLFMLQTLSGKRTGRAMVKVAVDLVAEGKLSPREAVLFTVPSEQPSVCATSASERSP